VKDFSGNAPCPEALRRLLDGEPQVETESQGGLTTEVRGSQLHIRVSLTPVWAGLMAFRARHEDPRRRVAERAARAWRRTTSIRDLWLKLFVLGSIAYLVITTLPAFLPGGAFWRLIGGR
jgi:hypothetical protein